MVAPITSTVTNIKIPQSEFLDPLTKRPSREWLFWLQNPNFVSADVNVGFSAGYLFSYSYIKSTTYIDSGTYVKSGTYMQSGSYITAQTHILAGDYMTAGSYITAGTTVNAGTDVNAGNDVIAANDVTAGANVNVTGYVASPTYIQMNTTPAVSSALGRLAWNDVDQTLNIGMDYNVVQQVGEETYARVANNTGSLIPNGTVVGFAGATTDALLVAPYIADGSQPTLYILGIMTHDLPDSGDKGYCTTWGFVKDVDTSAFTAGDVLYASPSVAGELTNVKPTAPDNVIPIAACVTSDATNGVIFVRPTIEQQQYYGTFSDTTTHTPAAIYTPYAITMDTTDSAQGVSRGSPTSQIIVDNSGLYKFAFSLQIEGTNSSAKKLWIWPRINGVDVANSNSEITIAGNNAVLVPAWSWTLSMNANDYFQIMYAVEDTGIKITSKAATTGANGTATFARPAVPSIILEVTQVQQ